MEIMQPWATGFNRPKPLPMQLPTQRPQQQCLSREEQMEARRLAEENNFSYAGYQVVRREFISHRFDPAMTVRVNSITALGVRTDSWTDRSRKCLVTKIECLL